MLCRGRTWHSTGCKRGVLETSELSCRQEVRSAIAAENERAQDFQTRIQAPRPACRTHGAASVVVQVATPVCPSPFAQGCLNPPLITPPQFKPFKESRLKPSKANSRCDPKANIMQLALPRLIRRASRKESACRWQVHETTRSQPHKTTGATHSPVQFLAEIEVADLLRNYVGFHLLPAPSRTAPLAPHTLDDISEKGW
jgi:hypothetical protein